jgi:hypothetical protein
LLVFCNTLHLIGLICRSLSLTPVDLQVDDRVVNGSEETGDFDDGLRNLEELLDQDTDMPTAM